MMIAVGHVLRRAVVVGATLLALVSCGPQKPTFTALDITGAPGYGTEFRLTDHNGKARTLSEFRGKAVALFFGFTFCPDVCPTTLSDMRKVMHILDKDAARLQVLFVTVDPKRDTAQVLSQYVPAFHPSFLGLIGDADATQKVAKDFRIIYREVPGKTTDSYTVDHTSAMLIFDPQNRLRLFVPYGTSAEKIAADIKQLL